MPSRAYYENLPTIEVFALTGVPTIGYQLEEPVVIDRTTDAGTENAIGCDHIMVFANLTVGPLAATALNVWAEWSYDGVTYSAKEYCGAIPLAINQTGLTVATIVQLVAPYVKLHLQSSASSFTCALYASPGYYEGQ